MKNEKKLLVINSLWKENREIIYNSRQEEIDQINGTLNDYPRVDKNLSALGHDNVNYYDIFEKINVLKIQARRGRPWKNNSPAVKRRKVLVTTLKCIHKECNELHFLSYFKVPRRDGVRKDDVRSREPKGSTQTHNLIANKKYSGTERDQNQNFKKIKSRDIKCEGKLKPRKIKINSGLKAHTKDEGLAKETITLEWIKEKRDKKRKLKETFDSNIRRKFFRRCKVETNKKLKKCKKTKLKTKVAKSFENANLKKNNVVKSEELDFESTEECFESREINFLYINRINKRLHRPSIKLRCSCSGKNCNSKKQIESHEELRTYWVEDEGDYCKIKAKKKKKKAAKQKLEIDPIEEKLCKLFEKTKIESGGEQEKINNSQITYFTKENVEKNGAAPIILSHSKIKDATPLFEHNYFKESVSITDFLNSGSNDSGDDDDNFDGDTLTATNHLRKITNVNSIKKCSRESSFKQSFLAANFTKQSSSSSKDKEIQSSMNLTGNDLIDCSEKVNLLLEKEGMNVVEENNLLLEHEEPMEVEMEVGQEEVNFEIEQDLDGEKSESSLADFSDLNQTIESLGSVDLEEIDLDEIQLPSFLKEGLNIDSTEKGLGNALENSNPQIEKENAGVEEIMVSNTETEVVINVQKEPEQSCTDARAMVEGSLNLEEISSATLVVKESASTISADENLNDNLDKDVLLLEKKMETNDKDKIEKSVEKPIKNAEILEVEVGDCDDCSDIDDIDHKNNQNGDNDDKDGEKKEKEAEISSNCSIEKTNECSAGSDIQEDEPIIAYQKYFIDLTKEDSSVSSKEKSSQYILSEFRKVLIKIFKEGNNSNLDETSETEEESMCSKCSTSNDKELENLKNLKNVKDNNSAVIEKGFMEPINEDSSKKCNEENNSSHLKNPVVMISDQKIEKSEKTENEEKKDKKIEEKGKNQVQFECADGEFKSVKAKDEESQNVNYSREDEPIVIFEKFLVDLTKGDKNTYTTGENIKEVEATRSEEDEKVEEKKEIGSRCCKSEEKKEIGGSCCKSEENLTVAKDISATDNSFNLKDKVSEISEKQKNPDFKKQNLSADFSQESHFEKSESPNSAEILKRSEPPNCSELMEDVNLDETKKESIEEYKKIDEEVSKLTTSNILKSVGETVGETSVKPSGNDILVLEEDLKEPGEIIQKSEELQIFTDVEVDDFTIVFEKINSQPAKENPSVDPPEENSVKPSGNDTLVLEQDLKEPGEIRQMYYEIEIPKLGKDITTADICFSTQDNQDETSKLLEGKSLIFPEESTSNLIELNQKTSLKSINPLRIFRKRKLKRSDDVYEEKYNSSKKIKKNETDTVQSINLNNKPVQISQSPRKKYQIHRMKKLIKKSIINLRNLRKNNLLLTNFLTSQKHHIDAVEFQETSKTDALAPEEQKKKIRQLKVYLGIESSSDEEEKPSVIASEDCFPCKISSGSKMVPRLKIKNVGNKYQCNVVTGTGSTVNHSNLNNDESQISPQIVFSTTDRHDDQKMDNHLIRWENRKRKLETDIASDASTSKCDPFKSPLQLPTNILPSTSNMSGLDLIKLYADVESDVEDSIDPEKRNRMLTTEAEVNLEAVENLTKKIGQSNGTKKIKRSPGRPRKNNRFLPNPRRSLSTDLSSSSPNADNRFLVLPNRCENHCDNECDYFFKTKRKKLYRYFRKLKDDNARCNFIRRNFLYRNEKQGKLVFYCFINMCQRVRLKFFIKTLKIKMEELKLYVDKIVKEDFGKPLNWVFCPY